MNEAVQLSLSQFANAWRLMCGASHRYASASLDGAELVFSGLPVPFFNIGLASGHALSAEALASAALRAAEWAADTGVPWLFITTRETVAEDVDVTAVLDAQGFAPLMPLTGMRAPSVAPATRALDGLQQTTPHDDAACAAITAINARAYAMALDAADAVIGKASFWRNQFPVVALKGGQPVASATVLMVDGYRYVALVATDPEHQRRGYADAVMRQALANAAQVHGNGPTVLHATEAGRPVYERMGYAVIANHTAFMEKRFLAEH